MKQKILLMLLTLGTSFQAMARPDKEVLKCEERSFSGLRVYLDSTSYNKNSGYTEAVGANIWHMFSGTRAMTCISTIRFDSYDIRCAGYYWPEELTELKVKGTGSNIFAEWTTSEAYGKIKKSTPCVLEEVKE